MSDSSDLEVKAEESNFVYWHSVLHLSAPKNYLTYAKMTYALHESQNGLATCYSMKSFIVTRETLHDCQITFHSLLILISCRPSITNINYDF